jgi:hypothetical protein
MQRRLFALLAVAACDGSTDSTAPQDVVSVTAVQAAAVPLPMKGTYEVWGRFADPPSGCAGSGARHAGGGVETHTGRYTITTHDCITGPDFTGSFRKTNANGDVILGTYNGTTELLQPPPVIVVAVTGTLTFTGGTGRFSSIQGTQTMKGRQTIDLTPAEPTIHTVLDLDGSITLSRPD